MYSDKFQKFIEMWQKEFAIEESIDKKVCLDRDGKPIPWYTYPAIEYLNQFDYSHKKIFEFGCGCSSAFWAERGQSVIGVEDKKEWFERWKREFDFANLQIRYCEEGEGYEQEILAEGESYDVIVIDGKRREKCAETAIKALASGGMIILDDSDRVNTSEEYRQAIKLLRNANLLQVDFYGFCPMNCYSKTTSLFLSRDFNFLSKYPVQPINGWGNLWSMQRKQRKEFFKKLG